MTRWSVHKHQSPLIDLSALPEDVKLIGTVELGVPLAVEALWERLKIGPALRKVMEQSGGSPLHERALLAMTANRLCDPDSKLGVWDRLLQQGDYDLQLKYSFHK